MSHLHTPGDDDDDDEEERPYYNTSDNHPKISKLPPYGANLPLSFPYRAAAYTLPQKSTIPPAKSNAVAWYLNRGEANRTTLCNML
jgi:hypothetical protein